MRIQTPWKLLLGTMLLGSCTKNEVLPEEWYACTLDAEGSQPEMHPNNEAYQHILDTHRPQGLVGAQLCIWDEHGLWTGGDGWSDVASAVPVTPCQPFLIASISKVFTAAAAFRLVDQGVLDVESPLSSWLDAEILDNIANAGDVNISDLLSHRSGIPDFYTLAFELARINRLEQGWSTESQRGCLGFRERTTCNPRSGLVLPLFQHQLLVALDGFGNGHRQVVGRHLSR